MSQVTAKVGDVVQLKSGGPKMTIRKKIDEDYLCQWFDIENYSKVREATFPKTSVVAVTKEASGNGTSYPKAGTFRSYAP